MPDEKRPLKVFICHAHADKARARDLYRTLKRRGLQPWLDAEDLLPGQTWQVEIPKALESSDAIIILLSKTSVDKEGYVQKEIKFALDKALEMPEGRIFLIPARLDECNVPRSISSYHWVDLFDDGGYEKLMGALELRADQLKRRNLLPPISDEAKSELAIQQESKKTPRKLNPEYIVAIIGTTVTIFAALIGILPQIIKPALTAKKTFTQQATTTFASTITPSPTILHTFAATEISPTLTSTPAITMMPTIKSSDFIDTDPSGNKIFMRLVPAGKFTMGSDANNALTECQKFTSGCTTDPFIDEEPPHEVDLPDYYIDVYEITNKLYKKCVVSGICTSPENVEHYDNSKYSEHPVTFVSWEQANIYCKWRSGRLPTETEWEKAARGIDARTYPWGEGINCNLANASEECGVTSTVAVGNYPVGASPYGIYDMAGNVWEWVTDWYDAYPGNTINNPDYGMRYRVLRGGAYDSAHNYYDRSSARIPGKNPINNDAGFRCVRTR